MNKKKIIACLSAALAATFLCVALTACGGEPEPTPPPAPPAPKTTLDWTYDTWTYTNEAGSSAKLDYAYYVPETTGDKKLPLITWIPDSSFLSKTIREVAETDSMPTIWATEANLEQEPVAFLILTLTNNSTTDSGESHYLEAFEKTTSEESQVLNIIDDLVEKNNLDTDRLYYTGQSMGGIFGWALNYKYPTKFAATVYVGCQPGASLPGGNPEKQDEMIDILMEGKAFLNQTFVYIGSQSDPGCKGGQDRVSEVFDEEEIDYVSYYELDAKDAAGNSQTVSELFTDECNHYFFGFPSVNNGSNEHLRSFKPSYEVNAIYNWLLQQSKSSD